MLVRAVFHACSIVWFFFIFKDACSIVNYDRWKAISISIFNLLQFDSDYGASRTAKMWLEYFRIVIGGKRGMK